jgi:hypothetical protein
VTTAAPTTAASGTNQYLAAAGNTDKAAYISGEKVNIRMVWQNVTAQNLTVEQFPPIISLMQKSTGQPVFTFKAGQTALTLAPGEQAEYAAQWDQMDAYGRPAVPGSYYVELEELYYQGQAVPMKLSSPVEFRILPASGGEKTLELNQVQTVNGITVTLQRLVFSDSGTLITAAITPPADYVLKASGAVLAPTKNYAAPSGYSLNRGLMQDAGLSTVEYFGSSMTHTWYIPGPLPANTTDLVFMVNAVGSWVGPWQFTVAVK